jgi:hypothetical protein
MIRGWHIVFLFLLALLIGAGSAEAQFRAGIQGTVTDPQGASIPGASVIVISQETNRVHSTETTGEGFYRIGGLPPGRYTVSVEAPGFSRKTVADFVVGAEEVRGLDIALELGPVEAVVTVRGEVLPALQTETGNISGTIRTEELLRLPQVGRDPFELLRLAPGVFGSGARSGTGQAISLPNNSGPGGSNSSIFQVENQVQISANGQRVSANNFTIDGVSVNSLTWGGAALVTPNQESVKEVRVLSSSYSAEDGRNTGAQVKVVSQNGTNEIHGSAIYKHGDPGLNAFNKYGGPGGASPFRVSNKIRQFGGSLGGPVVKDRFFFFFSYEGLRVNNTDVSEPTFVETAEFRDLVRSQRSGGTTAQIFGQPGIEPRVAALLAPTCANFAPGECVIVGQGMDIGSLTGSLGEYNLLGNALGGGFDGIPDIQRVQLLLPSRFRGNQYNARFDFHREKDQFAYAFFITQQKNLSPDFGGRSRPMGDVTFKPLNTSMTATWIRTLTPTMLNEARFNFTRFGADQVAEGGDVNWGIPRVEVEALPFDRIRFGPPWAETTPGIFAQNIYEFRDVWSYVFGVHGLKAGFDYRWEQDNNNLGGGARPLYSFHRLWNLANDTPIFEQVNADPRTGGPADAQRYFRTRYLGLFVQDDWKFRPNVTFNLGLRYEYFSPLREKRNRLTNLIFTPPNLAAATLQAVDELFEPDRNNFAPRLGFAWSPRYFDNKMVWRGGFGVAFNRIPQVVFSNTRGNPPEFARFFICCGTADADFSSPFADGIITYVVGSSTSPTSYPANPALAVGIDPTNGGVLNRSVEIYGSPRENPNGYVYLWSLETEYQFPWHIIWSLGYQGSSGHKLIRIVNQNFLYEPNRSGSTFFAVFFPTPDVNSNFHAMNLRIQRRFAHGFQMEGAYRWSKSIDTLSNEGPGAQTNQTNPGFLASERGPSDFDATHFLTITGLWDLPILRNRRDWVGRLVGGWQINTVLTAHSGFPWTPVTGRISSVPITGADTIRPARPTAYFGGAGTSSETDTFTRNNGNFPGIQAGGACPGMGAPYFDACTQGPPGIGRNSFRGPRFFGLDFSFVKSTALPQGWILGEHARLDLRANFFNAFNKLSLQPFGFNSSSTNIENPEFGMAARGLAGRVIEFQARFSF